MTLPKLKKQRGAMPGMASVLKWVKDSGDEAKNLGGVRKALKALAKHPKHTTVGDLRAMVDEDDDSTLLELVEEAFEERTREDTLDVTASQLAHCSGGVQVGMGPRRHPRLTRGVPKNKHHEKGRAQSLESSRRSSGT